MSVPRRFNKPQNLSRLDVLIEDTAVISKYFNITEFPEVLTQGKSSFLIGGSALLKPLTEVKFEIVNDDTGAVIYTEPVANYLEGTSRRVSIEIYDDNDLFGDCTLTAVGELNPSFTNVPPEFIDSYNVRYTRKVYVSGAGVNTQPILFYNQPRIHVTEIVKPYISTGVPTGSIISTGTLTGAPIPEDDGQTTNTQTQEEPAKFLKRKKKSLRTKLFGGGGNNSFIRKGRRRVRRSSPEADRYTITRVTGTAFNSNMIDGDLRIISASVGSSFNLESHHVVPTVFETPIEDVKNETTLIPEKPFVITDTRFNETDPQREVIVPLGEAENYTIEFTPVPTQSISTVNFRSYGDIRISRLRTFSGDIDRIKVYARNSDAFGDFEMVSDQQIESPELLFNVFGAGNQSLGFFLNQDTVNTYWNTKDSNDPTNTTSLISSTNMMNAVVVSGSNRTLTDNVVFELDGTYEMTFNDETEYEISFKSIGTRAPKDQVGGTTASIGRMGIFLSGSAFTINHELGDELGFQLETVDGTPAFIQVEDSETVDFGEITEMFQPTFDGKGVVKFVVFGGNFEIADVSIKPASATGFSPNFVQIIAPVPELTQERPDDYEFIAEFYDVNNNVAETITFASASEFAGGNNYIAGGDNLLSGSVFVGSAIGGGIEMAGVSSGLIRSIGYDGFVSASHPDTLGGAPGFMFFSGSVFPGSGDEYRGVGLELFGTTGSFFRYRSDPSQLQIVTDSFFVGTSGSRVNKNIQNAQYISGSQGNVEISSSDFHLTTDGNVTASSILLGRKSDGQFLQFVDGQLTVQGNLSVNQITTPATIGGLPSTILNASSSITPTGFAKFTSASIAGWDITTNSIQDINSSGKGIVITSHPSTPFIDVKEDDNNKIRLYHTSGTDWGIKGTSAGNIVFRLGNVNQIAGWTIGTDSLSGGSGDSFIALKPGTGIQMGNETFNNAPFSVTNAGVLKATEGTVAGWTLTTNTLEGGDLILAKDGSIRSRGYQSNTAGSGFILTAASGGFLEVENAKIRGTLATATFEKESVNAVGGQLYVANSTTLTSSIYALDGNHSNTQRTMSVVNSTGFAVGEIITAKKVSSTGFATEYMLIESASRAAPASNETDMSGFLYVERGYGSGTTGESGSLGDLPSTAQGYSGSQVIVSTGKVGTGYIRLNANPNDQTTPYMDIVERTGTGLYDISLKTRVGDLSGVAGSRNVPLGFTGFGIMSEVAFLSGSNIKLESPAFLLGDLNKNFVSGSDSNLEISSSTFHLKPDGSMILSGSTDTTLEITTGNFELDTPSLELSSTHASMSLGTGQEILIRGNSNSPFISLQPAVALPDKNYGEAGIFMGVPAGNPPLFSIVGGANSFIKFNGSVLDIKTEKAHISGSEITLETPRFFLGDSASAFMSGSNSNIEISSSGFHLQRDGSMQLGSLASGITLNSSGTATFNGSITIQTSDVEAALPDNLVSGSDQIADVTGSLSASSAAAQAATLVDSGSMASAISLTSTGMNILNSSGNTIAEYGADAIIGRTSGTNSNVKIDSDGNVDIRRGTEVSASFGTTTTIGSTIGNHVKITAEAIEVKTNATTTALSASAAGLAMSGEVNASSGTVGGFVIGSGQLNSVQAGANTPAVNISGSGVIVAGDITNPGVQDAVYMGVLREHGGSSGVSGSLYGNNNLSGRTYSELEIPSMNSGTHIGFHVDGGNFFKNQNGEAKFRVGANQGYPFMAFDNVAQELYISGSAVDIAVGMSGGRFRVSGSVVDLQSPSFYFGESRNFISGSDGKISISSDVFTLETNTMKLNSGTNSGKIAMGSTPNTSAAGTNQGTYMDGTGDFSVVGNSATKFIRFESGNFSIGSDNFNLSTAGDVTMSGELSAEAGTFQDINVMGSLVPNANAVGTNDGHKVVETWIDETTTISGGGTAALSANLSDLSDSSWGWNAVVNTGNASDVNIKFSDGPGVTYPSVAQMLLTENDDRNDAAADPPKAFFKSVHQAEGRLKGDARTRASKFLYDANVYKNAYGNGFGAWGGVPKMGVDLAEAGKTSCTLTSDAIAIPLTQSDIFECFLEFAIRDAGDFGGFYNISEVKILNASNDAVLYGDARQHNGTANWIIWSIPMVAKAGLVTLAGTAVQGDAFTLITSIKIQLKVGGFTSGVMGTYQGGAAELTANHSGGGGSLDGFIITEMRMRRAPYVAALETENIVISDIYPRRPGSIVTTRNIHKAVTRFQAPQFRGSDSDTYVDTSTANLVKIFAGGNESFNAASNGVRLPSNDCFLVTATGDQNNIADDSDVTVVFDDELIDRGNDFASNTFTASRTGAFQFNICLNCNQISATKHAVLKLKTSNRTYIRFIPGSGEKLSVTLSVTADMDNGDTAFVTLKSDEGSAQVDINTTSDSSVTMWFSGFFLG